MPSLDIENNFKFSKGDRVIITHYKHKRIEGEVVKITYSKCKTNSKYFVLYKVIAFLPAGPQDEIFSDYELEHINKDKERDWKLKQVLN